MIAAAGVRAGRSRGIHYQIGSAPTTSSKKPFRKGIVFTTISALVMICGVVMTILGFSDVFGAGVTMLGMLMIAVAILQFLYGLRMFLISSKLRHSEQTLQISRGTVASMVIEREDERGTLTVVMDAVNIEATCCRRAPDGSRPPDYTEAHHDYYPEPNNEGVIDGSGGKPPPYGPPTYDQAMYDKVGKNGKLGGESEVIAVKTGGSQSSPHGDQSVSVNSESTQSQNSENITRTSLPATYNGTVTVSHQEYNLHGDVNRPHEQQMSPYQDLPSVTL